MPVHIEQFETEISVSDGEMPLTPRQIDAIVSRVVERMRQRDRESAQIDEATRLRTEAAPPAPVEL